MNYVMLALAGILSGGIVFGAKILFMSGATLFEVMLFSNLIGAALFTPFVVKEFKRFIGVPPVITLLFTLSVLLVNVGDYVPLFMNVSVTLVLLLVYLQPIWTIMIERFYFKKHIAAADWVMVAVMFAGLIILINPFQGIHYSLVGMSLALFAGLGESVWILITKYFSKKGISPASTYWCTCFYAVVPLAVLYLLANRYMPRYEDGFTLFSFDIGTNLWISFLVYSLLIYTPANVLVFFNNKNVPAGIIGMILLLEPVTGITLDIVFLHNPLTWNIIVGGVIILAANIVLILKNSSMACRRHTAAFKMLSEKKSYSSSASSIRD